MSSYARKILRYVPSLSRGWSVRVEYQPLNRDGAELAMIEKAIRTGEVSLPRLSSEMETEVETETYTGTVTHMMQS